MVISVFAAPKRGSHFQKGEGWAGHHQPVVRLCKRRACARTDGLARAAPLCPLAASALGP